jgi:hypothetical protein
LPLYHVMRKSDHFGWTPEAQEALDSLKNMLKSPPIDAHVHRRDDLGVQCRAGGRARRTRKVTQGATLGILRERGIIRLKYSLLTNAKTCVCYLDDQAQAPPLL